MANAAATVPPFSPANAILGYSDNCGVAVTATLTGTATTGTDCNWAVTYTYTVKDACNNPLANQTYSHSGNDQTAPLISCVGNKVRCATTSPTTYTAVGTEFNPTSASDNCSITSVNYVLTGATTGSGSNTLNNVVFNAGVTNVTWTITDGCSHTANCSFTITVNPLPTPSISGPSPTCAGSSGNIYSTAFVPGNSYLWSVTGAASFTGQGTSQITVTWGLGATGIVNVTQYIIATGCSKSASGFLVTLLPLPAPVVGGEATVVAGAVKTYTTAYHDSHVYSWSVTGGVTDGSTTNVVVVTWGSTPGAGTVSVSEMDLTTGCIGNSTPYNVTIGVGGSKISGTVSYYNYSEPNWTGAGTPLDLVTLTLKQGSTTIATTTTNGSGYYQFTGVMNNTYTLDITTTKHWDGVNTVDAGLVNSSWGSLGLIEHVLFNAGDVNNVDNFMNGSDAGLIRNNYLYGASLYPFPRGLWTFWKQSDLTNQITPPTLSYNVVVSGGDITQNIWGLCVGDFSGNYVPPTGLKSSNAVSPMELTYDGTIQVAANTTFDMPIRVDASMQVGAIAIMLNLPSSLVSVENVFLQDGSNTGNSETLGFNMNGDELRIGWYSNLPVEVPSGDKLVTLRLKTSASFKEGQSIRITMKPDLLNELGDGFFATIHDPVLVTKVVEASATGINDITAQSLLFENHPNPFVINTSLTYTLPFSGKVKIDIHTLLGEKILTMVDAFEQAGNHSLKLDANDLMPGLYTATLRYEIGGKVIIKTIKMVHTR
ncbi:MAG: hypothetical protein NT040_18270 [Bacteroidetes bacterium]|nr:hypothetical protein [Bacteroidota bacterium]